MCVWVWFDGAGKGKNGVSSHGPDGEVKEKFEQGRVVPLSAFFNPHLRCFDVYFSSQLVRIYAAI